MAKTVLVDWVKQGAIHWEDWWVKDHGYALDRIPGLKDHISFANYDLERNGCPIITLNGKQLELKDVPDDKIMVVYQILDYHGFKVVSVS